MVPTEISFNLQYSHLMKIEVYLSPITPWSAVFPTLYLDRSSRKQTGINFQRISNFSAQRVFAFRLMAKCKFWEKEIGGKDEFMMVWKDQ